jgi:hypothetical protein
LRFPALIVPVARERVGAADHKGQAEAQPGMSRADGGAKPQDSGDNDLVQHETDYT